MRGEWLSCVSQKLSGEGGFTHPSQGEEFCEAEGFTEVGVNETNGLGDGLFVTG